MRRNHPLQKLRRNFLTKIMMAFAIAIIAIVGFTNTLILHKERHALLHNLEVQGKRTASFLAQTTRVGVYTENTSQLQPPMTAIMKQYDVLSVAIFTKTGHLLLKQEHQELTKQMGITNLINEKKLTPPSFPLLVDSAAIIQENDSYFLFWAPVVFNSSNFNTEEDLYFDTPPPAPQIEQIGTAVVAISIQGLKRQEHNVWVGTIIGSTILAMLCYAILYFILRHFTRPLAKLIDEVNKFGVTTKTHYDDMGVLTDTYSAMVEALSESFETIHGMKKDLETKVEMRTRDLATSNKALAVRQEVLENQNKLLAATLQRLKDTQSQLVQSEKMAALGQVVAGVAHEVNNTVNFISNALPVLQRRIENLLGEDEEQQQQFILHQITTLITNIDEGTNRTYEIVRDLQDFSRTNTTGMQHFSVNGGLDSTMAIIHPEYRKRITITKDYEKQLPQIICNPGQINQVFMNILLNAFQAIPVAGTVNIQTRKRHNKIHVYIRDNGPGIAAETIPHIFDPFFTTKEVGQGTGLGLGICYQIIHKHHGEIKVHSINGQGAEFEIILPITQPEPTDSETEQAEIELSPYPA